MSFQDILHKPTSAAKNQPESQAVAAAVFEINTAVSAFRRLVDALGTSKDTPDHRLRLHNTRQRILKSVKAASAKIKSLTESDRSPDVDHDRRSQDAKLAKDFQATLKEFQKVQQLASERESKISPKDPPPSSITISSSHQNAESSSFEGDNEESMLMEHESGEVYLLDNDIAFNEAVIEEREQGIEEIEEQVRDVNVMFKDIAVLIHEHGVTIDDIDHNIDASAVSTTQAKVTLSKGSKSVNSKASRCWLMVAIIVAIVVIILVVILL